MTSFSWDFPYTSQRMPVLARNVVATSQPLAAQAGLRMLLKGGNAVDAALATAIALTVVEPVNNGIGSDAFCVLWDGKELHGLNGSGRAPAAWAPEQYTGLDQVPTEGWPCATVPGAVSVWVELSQRYGKLDFGQLFEPALQYARDGYMVGSMTAAAWAGAETRLGHMESWASTFLVNGRAPRTGERFSCPDQARTLERIAETRGEAYYRGELGERIAAHAAATGGRMTARDLADHRCDWVGTVSQGYREYALHEIPPNGQGLTALIALGILQSWDLAQFPVDSADSFHVQIEAVKLALRDAYRYIADPAAMDLSPEALLDPVYLAQRAKLIDLTQAADPEHGRPPGGGTVYLTAADAEGMMVSYIQSDRATFGSGVTIPGTGITLQNRGIDFTLEPGHPNEVGGGKRSFHTIIPGFLMRDGAPVMSFGVMGGTMQAQGHTQIVVRLVDYHQNPQAAADAPRFRVWEGRDVHIEDHLAPAVLDELESRGHVVTRAPRSPNFGGGQFIHRLEEGYCAASEPRKEGQAVGY